MLPNNDPNSPYYYNKNVKIDNGNYEGECDEDGMRRNVGTCKWDDGSYYRGDWAQNVRHGNGVFVANDGIKFEG